MYMYVYMYISILSFWYLGGVYISGTVILLNPFNGIVLTLAEKVTWLLILTVGKIYVILIFPGFRIP